MANSVQILNKIARDAKMLGLTVESLTATTLVINDDANDINISYEDAVIQDPMGGVDPSTSPFLGTGTSNPGMILFTCNATGNKSIAQIFVNATNVIALSLCMGFGNKILVMDGNEGYGTAAVLIEIESNSVLKGIGQ